jgi:hypothetical protein
MKKGLAVSPRRYRNFWYSLSGEQCTLPLFAGLDYIKHKNRVQQLIECYRKRIKEEEISDILEG